VGGSALCRQIDHGGLLHTSILAPHSVLSILRRVESGRSLRFKTRFKEGLGVGRIIVANRRGHQLVEWDAETQSEEARESILEAERILREARDRGCAVSKKVGTQHVLDDGTFDPYAEEYQIIAPIAGG
jgi:hypothetical protein